MHKLRTEAFIEAIEEAYSVKFEKTSEEIALSGEALHPTEDVMKENGKPFRITQGLLCSSGMEDYSEKYALASSIEVNAYNYEDLQSVIKLFNQNATVEDLRALAEAYTYEDALARRK